MRVGFTLRIAMAATLALAQIGCDDRTAGTEVGNPDIAMNVTARIIVIGDPGRVEISSLVFKMFGMGYGAAGKSAADSGTCWKRPDGILMDMARFDCLPLADTLVEARSWPWTWAHLVLRTPEGPTSLPDSSDFNTWTNPRYVKFHMINGSDTLPALFEMPAGTELQLAFTQASLQFWPWQSEIWVPFVFDASLWTANLNLAGPWKTHTDGKHARYVLLSPSENAIAWAHLKAGLATAFVADTVQVMTVPAAPGAGR
ncbi:MAG: hypothetical protein ABIW76_22955 [Fibrobacteria bacterium]